MDFVENFEYSIYSTIGELILSGMIDLNNKTIDLSNLSSNIYLLKVGSKTMKLIKPEICTHLNQ